MVKFRIGSIPVHIHASHLIFSGLLSFSFGQAFENRSTKGWPYELLQTEADTYMAGMLGVVLSGMAIIFISVLVHELGHATMAQLYGRQPSVHIEWLGGRTEHKGEQVWWKDVLLILAGPIFGFLLAMGAAAGMAVSPPDGFWSFFFYYAMAANLFWTGMNLMPVLPLDGGAVSMRVLTRLFGDRGFLLSQALALLVAGGITAYAAIHRMLFIAIFFGIWAFHAFQRLTAYRQQSAGASHPVMAEVSQLLANGELRQAGKVAEGALATNVPVNVRSSLHHVLGKLAIKESNGRAALDHFSQVQNRDIEPEALAAAFSLIGDETRALAFWEAAYHARPDSLLLHEWAGSLIRAGMEEKAAKLPGVQLAKAYRCAESVAYLRGAFSEAARFGQQALELEPSASSAYDVACSLALAGDRSGAVRLLQRAIELGFNDFEYLETDSDLASLHGHPQFSELVGQLKKTAVR